MHPEDSHSTYPTLWLIRDWRLQFVDPGDGLHAGLGGGGLGGLGPQLVDELLHVGDLVLLLLVRSHRLASKEQKVWDDRPSSRGLAWPEASETSLTSCLQKARSYYAKLGTHR